MVIKWGHGILKQYDNSVSKMLTAVFTELNWHTQYQTNVPRHYWSLENQRKFLDELASALHITTLQEWSQISRATLLKTGGSFFVHNHNGISQMIVTVYPELCWDPLDCKCPGITGTLWKTNANFLTRWLLHCTLQLGPILPNDYNACTTDTCNAENGCTYTPVNCNDNYLCTSNSCDSTTGNCNNTYISCDDENACTDNNCNALTGCTYCAVICDDFNAFTQDLCDEEEFDKEGLQVCLHFV